MAYRPVCEFPNYCINCKVRIYIFYNLEPEPELSAKELKLKEKAARKQQLEEKKAARKAAKDGKAAAVEEEDVDKEDAKVES